jgi:hypothetical protein
MFGINTGKIKAAFASYQAGKDALPIEVEGADRTARLVRLIDAFIDSLAQAFK